MSVARAVAIVVLALFSVAIFIVPYIRPAASLPPFPKIPPLELQVKGMPEPRLKSVRVASNSKTDWLFSFQTLQDFIEKRRFVSPQTDAELARLKATKDAIDASRKIASVVRLVENDMKAFGLHVLDAQRELNSSYKYTMQELDAFKAGVKKSLDETNDFIDKLCKIIGAFGALFAIGMGILTYREKLKEDRVESPNVPAAAAR